MIVIYTGIEEIDKEIQANLRDSIIAHYSDYLIEHPDVEQKSMYEYCPFRQLHSSKQALFLIIRRPMQFSTLVSCLRPYSLKS